MYMMRIGRKRNIIRYGLLGGLASEILGCPLPPIPTPLAQPPVDVLGLGAIARHALSSC